MILADRRFTTNYWSSHLQSHAPLPKLKPPILATAHAPNASNQRNQSLVLHIIQVTATTWTLTKFHPNFDLVWYVVLIPSFWPLGCICSLLHPTTTYTYCGFPPIKKINWVILYISNIPVQGLRFFGCWSLVFGPLACASRQPCLPARSSSTQRRLPDGIVARVPNML